jgi:phosphoribosylformimino-5-aminoimidazole carboxamide ribotide isomerase
MVERLDASFNVIPSIDLLGGEVVRLRQGMFDQSTAYSADPVAVALGFADAGARWIHVVDLDGARKGERVQASTVRRLIEALGDRVRVQVAGGLRTPAAVAEALEDGAARVVLGTAAIGDPELVRGLIGDRGSERIAVAIDVRDGMAVGEGWRDGAPGREAEAVVRELAGAGAGWFAVTAIERDGLLEGPDLGLLGDIVAMGSGRVIASGGISSIHDLRAVREVGCSGAIVGRSIYEGRLDLRESLATV